MNQSDTYQPYSYRVTHIETGKFYYGIQYGNNAHPDNIWNTYFTSSNTISVLRDVFGDEAFSIDVRQTFISKKEAVEWETKVLMVIKHWDNCLNCLSGYGKNRKKHITDGKKNKMVNKNSQIPEGWRQGITTVSDGNNNRGKSSVGKIEITDGKTNKRVKPDTTIPEGWVKGSCGNNHNKGKICVNNGVVGRIVFPEEVPEGYVRGKLKNPNY